jgi:cysteine desulfurase/selenocysteine lyase
MNVKRDFPIFHKHPNLIYLDSAATALKPQAVLDKMAEYYTLYSTNVHRGLYPLAEQATEEYEKARATVAHFLNAEPNEIVFTRSATEAINLVAYSFARNFLNPTSPRLRGVDASKLQRSGVNKGQAIVITEIEHHSNIVPWYLISTEQDLKLIWWPVEEAGTLNLGVLQGILKDQKVGLVAVTGMSNVLGTLPDIASIVKTAHKAGAKVLVDAAQLAVHGPIDVKAQDVDFLALTGHKLYGPTGIGVLYGKSELLDAMPPFEGGGEMIREVRKEEITFNEIPHKFEAGTPPIAQAIGLGAAIKYLESLGWKAVQKHGRVIAEYAMEKLSAIDGLRIFGPKERGPLVSFVLEGVHPHDLGTLLGEENIAVRAGHHCAMVLHSRLGIPATTRASFGVYTTKDDIDRLVIALKAISERFARARR